ncbi:LysM peptidoglycan-binding domain-containing protein [Elusimicrobiota bacterium]
MKKKCILAFFSALLLVMTGCAKKSAIPEANVSWMEAEQAIVIAQAEIDEAREVGAKVREPQKILNGAKESFDAAEYIKAKKDADIAREMAIKLKQEILANVRTKEDAEAAIGRARKLIDKASGMGANTAEPEQVLARAQSEFDSGNYSSSIELADEAAGIAQKLIDMLGAGKYVVKTWESSRDCLWNIAGRKSIYNDFWKWKKIYQANSDKIKNPDLIYPGQILLIPGD